MGIRPKLFLVFFACGILPMLLLSVVNYWNGMRAVEALLRDEVERDVAGITSEIDARQRQREAALMALARASSVREYVRGGATERPAATNNGQQSGSPLRAPASSGDERAAKSMRADVGAFFLSNQKYYAAITYLDAAKRPLLRVERGPRISDETIIETDSLHFKTENFLPDNVVADERVWTASDQTPLRSPVARESSGATVRYTLPVFTGEEVSTAPRGALIVEMKLDALLREAISSLASSAQPRSSPASSSRQIIVLDRVGRVVYHTNEGLQYQPIISAVPSFKTVADAMMGGESGWKFYDAPEGNSWLAVYRPVTSLGLSAAATGNYTDAVRSLRRAGLINIILSALVGLLTAILLTRVVQRTTRSIERVTEGAVAIAGGNLSQRIEVRSSDETRLLAESFNRMTDRLREQIAREAESRQFQSFMRLSAMLTHDLKNAISALSLLVRNMERQFDNEKFRADAMRSLKGATDKLRALVAKLSEPVQSLSGEHQQPRPTDLIPIIKRVLASTAEPVNSFHKIETRLPPTLVATVEADRFEKVIENLILNALEAMGANQGKLTVEAGSEADGKIFISVTDTGVGMSEEFQRTRLFHAFATTKAKGVGLGLYTCREVIKAHGGQIEVESRKDAGTTFRVVLPSSQITEPAASRR